MGRLVDDAVVVLESTPRHQKKGWRSSGPRCTAPTRSRCGARLHAHHHGDAPAGDAARGPGQEAVAPLALTSRGHDSRPTSSSVCVTRWRVAILGTEPSGLWRRIERAIDRLANAMRRRCARRLPFRGVILGGALVLVLGRASWRRGCRAQFFPEIDESMERVYVRFAPGTSLDEADAPHRSDRQAASRRSDGEQRRAGCSPTSLAQQRAAP